MPSPWHPKHFFNGLLGAEIDDVDLNALIERMARFPAALSLREPLPLADARWRPAEGGWSILEIVNHVGDEERLDFRARVELTLRDPSEPWPPIEPEAWPQQRDYNGRNLASSLERFASERATSLAWLRGLEDPDWSKTYTHPSLGSLRAGDILLSWAAHDPLHARQIAQRLFQLATRDAAGFSADYAGGW